MPDQAEQHPGRALLPPLDPEAALQAAGEVGVPEVLARLNVFRVLLRRPALAKGTAGLLLALLGKGSLAPRLRELQILRVAWRRGSAYEWSQHWRIASDLGVPESELLAVREGPGAPGWDVAARLVLEAADDVVADGRVSEATLVGLCGALGEEAALEAVVVPAVWAMVAVVLSSLEVPLEEGLGPWLPDGVGPQ